MTSVAIEREGRESDGQKEGGLVAVLLRGAEGLSRVGDGKRAVDRWGWEWVSGTPENEVMEEQSLQVRTRSRVGSWGQVGHKGIGERRARTGARMLDGLTAL